jgi:predicted nucleotidyltransferase
MTTSGQTYKELAIPYFKEVFQIIDEVLSERSIPYYLVGVNAIALELLESGYKPSRGTKDIDFAIMISSIRAFDEVSDQLVVKGFNKVKAPWTLYHPDYKIVIDLLPFGEVEENDTENFNRRYSDLHVLGFKEVLAQSKEIKIENKIARIPPLHGMVILKLVAWSDRPEERGNDPFDILYIITKYFDLEFDEITTNHNDTFPEGELDQLLVAARVLGRKAAEILQYSFELKRRILSILETNSIDPESSSIARQWVKMKAWDLRYAGNLLGELKKGIEEVLKRKQGMNSLGVGERILKRIGDEKSSGKTQVAHGLFEFIDPSGKKRTAWLVYGELGKGFQPGFDIKGNIALLEPLEVDYLKSIDEPVFSKNSPFGNAISELNKGIGWVELSVKSTKVRHDVITNATYEVKLVEADAYQGKIFTAQDNGLLFEKSLKTQLKVLEGLLLETDINSRLSIEQKIIEIQDELANVNKRNHRYRRTTTSIRQQFLLDAAQNKIKRSKLFNGPLVIDGGPGTGKTTLLIHRIQYLLDKEIEGDENLQVKLSNEEAAYIRNQKTGWIFFTPTTLLKKYLEQAMNVEGLAASDETVRTWDQQREILKTLLQFFTGSKGFMSYRDSKSLWNLTALEVISLTKEFDTFYLAYLKNKVDKIRSYASLATPWKRDATRISALLSERSTGDYQSLIRTINQLKDEFRELRQQTSKDYNDQISDLVTRVQGRLKDEDKTWFKDLFQKSTETLDSESDEDEGNENFEDDATAGRFEYDVNKTIRKAIRNRSIQTIDPSHRLSPRDQQVFSKVGALVPEGRIETIASAATFLKCFNAIFEGSDTFILSPLVTIYKAFRRNKLTSIEWLSEETRARISAIIEQAPRSRRLHDDEIDFLILASLRLARTFWIASPEIFRGSNQNTIAAFRECMKGIVAVDEATDFSPVQLSCMYLLSMPRINSITFSGDLMQQMSNRGLTSWESVKELFPSVEVKSLIKSYRQTPRLLKLASTLYKSRFGRDPNFVTAEDGSDNPPPLYKISSNLKEKAQWIAVRIVELFVLYENVIPNIAIFVKDDESILPLAKALNDTHELYDKGVQVKPCLGDTIGSADYVRVFNINLIKGMEFESVFFVDVDQYIDEDILDKLIYVGVSRATYYLAITLIEKFPEELIPIRHLLLEDGKWTAEIERDY